MVVRILAVLALVAGIGGAAWYLWPEPATLPSPPPPLPRVAVEPVEPVVTPRHPVEVVVEEGLPPLKESDAAMLEALSRIVGNRALQRFFNLDNLARRIVATVDNLAREEYASRLNPVKPTAGTFLVAGPEAARTIAAGNAARYTPFVTMVEGVDLAVAVGAYRRMYPLLQEAYMELGYPKAYFNDRLIEVIDSLLDTPELAQPIPVVVRHVLYEYADPDLEALPSGQKAMLRVGPENAARLKTRLREIRAQISSRKVP